MDFKSIAPEALEAEWKESFMMFNKFGTGQVESKALAVVSEGLGQTRSDVAARSIIREADALGHGYIDANQFADIMTREMQRSAVEEEYIQELFRAYDRDRDGFVSKSDIRDMFQALGIEVSDADAEFMIKEADIDADGLLSQIEFFDVVRQVLG
jgi:calmodulin